MKMKKHTYLTIFLSIVVAGLAIVTFSGCASFRKVSADEFMSTANRIGEPLVNTLPDYIQIIGCTSDRAYLEYRPAITFFGPRVRVYWTPLTELPKHVQEELKKGSYPPPRSFPQGNIDWNKIRIIDDKGNELTKPLTATE
jgi:hypothetical protein